MGEGHHFYNNYGVVSWECLYFLYAQCFLGQVYFIPIVYEILHLLEYTVKRLPKLNGQST